MDWIGIFETWNTAKITNKRKALSLHEVGLDGRFLICHIVLETCTI